MLEIQNVKKLYTSTTGVKEISLLCKEGETVAFIGPNGVGKSTILKIVSGILKADEGTVLLNGKDTAWFGTRQNIGYMPEHLNVGKKISAKELLYLISDYKYKGKYKEKIDESIKNYALENQCNKPFCKLSMGSKKKVGSIIAFMGNPELIILDEPTNGVDTAGIICMKRDITEAKNRGCSVIVSSHILDFIGSIADRSIFLKNGQIEHIVKGKENLEEIYTTLYL
ncbi:MAG: ATP-binding cassette domain-containing protein [Lachnospiraceae bacterium]|nr:ATP-binding cassette domain-containing protein [Lachnospiraceae bacterium]